MKLKMQFFLLIHLLIILDCYENVFAQDVPPENRIAVSPFGVGGMLQGLLSMQELSHR
ncbi:unnamed protein product [Larinioides sclopetarius]|uniref:Uncharacterized protein n=1 Tax=Larinioides sclopetarius TaxID=280406 RepID=A0AAV1Z0U3_9ARAC